MSASPHRPWLELASEDEYYIPTRYPAGLPGAKATGMPDKDDAQIAIAAAERILNFVQQELNG